ncbi:MAG: IPT/TIG domain-containing protein, partial [Candidatus Angelobacter sp.]
MVKYSFMKFLFPLLSLFFFAVPSCIGQTTPPRIFFSDLESGPNIGGQKNHGVWVTIWGKGFGAERGGSTVTVGGGAAAEYPIWTDTKITFQLGPATKTGDIVVSVQAKAARAASVGGSNGGSNINTSNKSGPAITPGSGGKVLSNGIPFTVRPGKIFFVALNGSNRQKGSLEAPWKTIVHAKDRMSAGDVTYIRDGVAQTSEDNFTAYLSMDRDGGGNSGKPGAPKTLVAYPGARVTIGKAHGLEYGIRTPNIAAHEDYWVISQMHIVGGRQAIDMSGTGWKIV